MIHNYIIEGVLGSGAMGIVYLAKNRLEQRVAIKVLPEQMTLNELSVKRFEREARLISRLDHPHVVRVLDFFFLEDNTTPAMVMQYLPGGTLTQHLQNNPGLTLVDMVDIIRQLAEALDYAHSLDIVHRDIKLDNVLLYDTGQVALSDFGLARALNETTLTNTGALLGTPYYMSPEQIQPNRYPLDHRADLYALGIMSYVLTTGVYPFNGSDAASVLHQHLAAPPPVPTDLNPELPEIINPVLMRAIAKDPDTRYPTALAFAVAMMEAANMNPSLPITVSAVGAGSTETIDLPPEGKPKRTVLPKQSGATQQPPPRPNRWIPMIAVIFGIGALTFALGQAFTFSQLQPLNATRIAAANNTPPDQPINGGNNNTLPNQQPFNTPQAGGGQQNNNGQLGGPPNGGPRGGDPNLCSTPGEIVTVKIMNYMRESIRLARKSEKKEGGCPDTDVITMPNHASFMAETHVGEIWRIYRLPENIVLDDFIIEPGMTQLNLGNVLPGMPMPTLTPSPMP